MPDEPCMTFVIPTFNRPEMLQQAVECCLEQTVAAEVIVVDHGSSDETRRVCERLPPTVNVVRRERDSGPIFAWLDGVLHASTEFINLHFDDDLKNPRFAEECIKLMQEGVGMVFTQARIVDALGTPTSSVLFRDWFTESAIYPSRNFSRFFRETLVSPCAALYRRQHLIDALYVGRLPNQEFDYHGVGPDLYLQLLAQLKYPWIGYVAEELAYFRAHPGSITIDASASGRSEHFTRAYEDARLAVLDLRVARASRRLRLHRATISGFRLESRLRRRISKRVRRYRVTLRHLMSTLSSRRDGTP